MRRNRLNGRIKNGVIQRCAVPAITMLMGCASPMQEGIRNPSNTGAEGPIEVGEIEIIRQSDRPGQKKKGSDPYSMTPKMEELAASLEGQEPAIVAGILHGSLRKGAPEGVTVDPSQDRPPRTAEETLELGGDCTDFAGVVIPILESAEVSGGALIVHFKGDPENSLHMVPYASIGGSDVIIDLQTADVGTTADGEYSVVHKVSYEQARYMYHAEMGDYHKQQGNTDKAIASYQKAVEIYDGDAYVHHNLGVLLEQSGNMEEAKTHLTRAAELNPAKYGKAETRASYNELLDLAYAAYEQKRWAECAQHFRAALNSGESLSADERSTLEQNIGVCERNSAVITSE
jgi:hypothetical protein